VANRKGENMTGKRRVLLRRLARVSSLLVVSCLALAAISVAQAAIGGPNAVDVDGNGYYDAYIREPGFYTAGNVGVACNYFTDSNNVPRVKMTVRPPRVWPINGFSSQQVAWRMVAWNYAAVDYTDPRSTVSASAWNAGTAYSSSPTEFGGGGDGYPFSVFSPVYFAGSQTITVPTSLGQWQPGVEVAWLNPSTGIWKYAFLRVHSALISASLATPVC
jgi:hypothetical protein